MSTLPNISGTKTGTFWIVSGTDSHEERAIAEVLTTVDRQAVKVASSSIAALLSLRRGDRVLIRAASPLRPLIFAAFALAKGAAYELLIEAPYPEAAIAAGNAREGSLLVRSIRFTNRWLYKHAARIAVRHHDIKALLEVKTQGLEVPITVVEPEI